MAQAGKTPIQLFYSPTPGNVPTTSNLVLGELAINIADGKMFYLDPTATIVEEFNPNSGSLDGGLAGSLPYQSAPNTTTFLNIGTVGKVLTSDGSVPTWSSYNALTIGTGLSGTSYNPSSATTIAIANTGVTAGTYGTAISVPQITVNAQGQITNVVDLQIDSPSYQGVWDASANTPLLASSVGTEGYYYIVSVAGTTNLNGVSSWSVGDWAIFGAGVWSKVSNSQSSVFNEITVTGLTGFMYANRTSEVTASTTIPNTSITGLGTMSTQAASSVAITGGTINGAVVGGTTAAAVTGTTVTASTQFTGAGTGLTGTASSLSIGGTAAKATNVAGGASGSLPYQSGANATSFLGIGTDGQVLSVSSGAPAWESLSGVAVTSLSGGTTGLTPNTATKGDIVLGGVLAQANGGTGVANTYRITVSNANQVLDQAVNSGSAPTFTGTNFSAIGNAALTNSSITFGSTSQALGSTVSALDGVAIGSTTAAAGYFTTLNATSGISGGVF